MEINLYGELSKDGFPELEICLANDFNEAVKAIGIVDTGAAKSHIATELAEYLKLQKVSKATHHNPINGEIKSYVYRASSMKIQDFDFGPVDFIGFSGKTFPYKIILGLGLIRKGTLVYSGVENNFRLSFP
jgi:hypothetical protein